MLVGVLSVQNLLNDKAVLRSFELASDLKVNFGKSYLYIVHVRMSFLDWAHEYIHGSSWLAPPPV